MKLNHPDYDELLRRNPELLNGPGKLSLELTQIGGLPHIKVRFGAEGEQAAFDFKYRILEVSNNTLPWEFVQTMYLLDAIHRWSPLLLAGVHAWPETASFSYAQVNITLERDNTIDAHAYKFFDLANRVLASSVGYGYLAMREQKELDNSLPSLQVTVSEGSHNARDTYECGPSLTGNNSADPYAFILACDNLLAAEFTQEVLRQLDGMAKTSITWQSLPKELPYYAVKAQALAKYLREGTRYDVPVNFTLESLVTSMMHHCKVLGHADRKAPNIIVCCLPSENTPTFTLGGFPVYSPAYVQTPEFLVELNQYLNSFPENVRYQLTSISHFLTDKDQVDYLRACSPKYTPAQLSRLYLASSKAKDGGSLRHRLDKALNLGTGSLELMRHPGHNAYYGTGPSLNGQVLTSTGSCVAAGERLPQIVAELSKRVPGTLMFGHSDLNPTVLDHIKARYDVLMNFEIPTDSRPNPSLYTCGRLIAGANFDQPKTLLEHLAPAMRHLRTEEPELVPENVAVRLSESIPYEYEVKRILATISLLHIDSEYRRLAVWSRSVDGGSVRRASAAPGGASWSNTESTAVEVNTHSIRIELADSLTLDIGHYMDYVFARYNVCRELSIIPT